MLHKSGFKTREAYNAYKSVYARGYRAKQKMSRVLQRNRIGFLELEVQRLNHCLEVALNK